MSLKAEIFEQPAILRTWLDRYMPQAQAIAKAIRARDIEYVFLAARGTSDHAGVYAQYLWGSLNRLPVAFAAPSLFTMYEDSPRLQHALVVGISQSGQSPDVWTVMQEGRKQGALTVALTNAPNSPLAQSAEFHLDVQAGEEKAVAATKSYTAELLAVAAIAAALTGNDDNIAALLKIPDAAEKALELDSQAEAIARTDQEMRQCVVLARGYNYCSAQEWALKLKELAYVFADPYSAADFQHGPIAIVDRGFHILSIAPSGAVLGDLVELLSRLRDVHGAHLLVISDADVALKLGHSSLRLPSGVPEWLSPLVSIIPAQLYAYHLTQAKGYNTESPRSIHKVTLTH